MQASIIDLTEEILPEKPHLPKSMEIDIEKPLAYHDTPLRWVMLFLISVTAMGRYYCFGLPQSLQSSFYSQLGIGSMEFNLFFAVYAVPNFVLPIFGGFLCDRLGIRKSFFLFSSFVLLGNLLFWHGCAQMNYLMALFGRFLFGIGGESILVLRFPMTVRWFREDELGLAGGLTVFCWRIASLMNSLITTRLAEESGDLKTPTFIGFLICTVSFLSGFCFLHIDKQARKKYKHLHHTDIHLPGHKSDVKLNSFLHFEGITWLSAIIAVFGVSTYLSFTNVGNNFIQKEYGFELETAGDMMAGFYFLTAILNPIFGLVADRMKNKLILLQISFVFLVLSFLSLLILPRDLGFIDDSISLFLMAIFVAMFSGSYYPMLTHLEDKRHLGMIMGLVGAVCNIGEGILPLLIGMISEFTSDVWDGYYWVIVFELGIALVGLLLTFALQKMDRKCGRIDRTHFIDLKYEEHRKENLYD